MSYRIWIGWDSRFPVPAKVLAYSLRKHSSVPLDIRYLDLAHLERCYGFVPRHDPKATTEFTYSRFLVPYLCDYAGTALFLDNDMVCLGDVAEVFQTFRPLERALTVRQHAHRVVDGSTKMYGAVQTSYPRKNWSSMMLMDCGNLRCWTKDAVQEADGARLHRFKDLSDDQVGHLPPGWNDLEHQYDPAATRLLHWTEGGPWYPQYEKCPHADLWRKYRDEAFAAGAV